MDIFVHVVIHHGCYLLVVDAEDDRVDKDAVNTSPVVGILLMMLLVQ